MFLDGVRPARAGRRNSWECCAISSHQGEADSAGNYYRSPSLSTTNRSAEEIVGYVLHQVPHGAMNPPPPVTLASIPDPSGGEIDLEKFHRRLSGGSSSKETRMRREFSQENLLDAMKNGGRNLRPSPAGGRGGRGSGSGSGSGGGGTSSLLSSSSANRYGLARRKSSSKSKETAPRASSSAASAAAAASSGAGDERDSSPSSPADSSAHSEGGTFDLRPRPLSTAHETCENDEEGEFGSSWSPCSSWSEVGWDPGMSHTELVDGVHSLMLRLLTDAIGREYASGDRWEVLKVQLREFVDRVSTLYRPDPKFHNWGHACHVVQAAEFLARGAVAREEEERERQEDLAERDVDDRRRDEEDQQQEPRRVRIPPTSDPWLPFVAAFCALIHDARHLGVTNKHLETQHHLLSQMYDRGSCQERRSLHVGLGVFAEEFPELSGEVLSCCPSFVRLVRSAVLATDISSPDVQRWCREKFDRALRSASEAQAAAAAGGSGAGGDADAGAGLGLGEQPSHRAAEEERARTEATLEHILLLADVGHGSQGYEQFLRWNRAFYRECAENHAAGRGDGKDPRDGWYQGQIGFLEHYIGPLAERCEHLMPRNGPGSIELRGGVDEILRRWRAEGKEWTDRMIEELAPCQSDEAASQLSN